MNRGRKIFVKTKSSLFENRNFCSKLFIINLLGKWTKPIWRLKFQNKFQKLKKSGSIDVFSITAQFIQEFCTKLEIYFNLGKKIKINWRNCQSPTLTHQSLHKFHKEIERPFSLLTTFPTKIPQKIIVELDQIERNCRVHSMLVMGAAAPNHGSLIAEVRNQTEMRPASRYPSLVLSRSLETFTNSSPVMTQQGRWAMMAVWAGAVSPLSRHYR